MGRRPKNTVKYKVPENTYLHIEAFMVNDLHLSGNELIIYAAIFGFSQDGSSWFTGSRKYLGGWCQITDETVTYNLNKLLKKGLIECREKKVHDVVFKDYRAIPVILGGTEKSVPPDEKPVPDPEKTSQPTEKTTPHTIDTYNSSHTIVHTKKEERKKPAETYDSIIDGFTQDQELREALRGFLQYRMATARRQKKAFTNQALKLNLTKLRKLSSDPMTMTAIVNQTVEKGWSGFFELKDGQPRKPQRQIDLSEHAEPSVGTVKSDWQTGKTEVYKGNGVWEDYVSDYVPQEGEEDIDY